MPPDTTKILLALSSFLVFYLLSRWWHATTHELRHIPTVGSAGVISSYIDAWKFYKHGHKMIEKGYQKYRGSAFKVPMMSRWMVVVSGPDMINDIRRATDEQLSFREAVAEIAQSDYMIGPQIRLDPYHVAIVRTPLTRNLGVRFEDIKDEIDASFSDLVCASDNGWTSVPVYKTIMKVVCRTGNRVFVGLPLCRNSEYLELVEQFTMDVIKGGRIINMFPASLKPIVGRLLTKVPRKIDLAIKHTGPLLQKELNEDDHSGKERVNKPNNLISWLIDEARGPQRELRDLALRLLSVNFAATHTTTMAFTHILYDLATYPEYVAPMREEVESIIAAEGWTKASVDNMHKVDSFVKESQRIAIGGLMMRRKVKRDFTFSNGITIPAGTHLAVATNCIHMDENHYKEPGRFQGFRFAELREKEGEDLNHQMVSLSLDYGTFGTGRHACPGRFFAVSELKTMLAYVLLNYDIKFPRDGTRPTNFWFSANCIPNPMAEVLFKKRMA
ncbi:hypothetical protein D9613_005419 [Agrocybe pediades]|uniref:Cytochrome P450 n=1 Tax=Agrocybe pediades TaxID=84607 RepID=A0A8H4VRL1_9AGAR|nr:hypothetical protein D9613_005419 [Agrocybe pediades]